MAADIAAPTDEEIAHEYSTDTATTDRAFSRFVKSTRAAISLNASEIRAEVERATTSEGNLSSRITINANSITSEVTRAKNAESSLSTRITQNANSISAEVTRATKAEGTLSANITATAESIKSTVAASGVWDSNGYNISVNGFGTPSANKISASSHRNQYYLDKSSGRLWWSNGSTWSGSTYLISIQSSLHQTADSISATVTRQGNEKLDKYKGAGSSSFGWNLTADSFSLKSNSSTEVFLANNSGIWIKGNANVTGKITATSGYIGGTSGFTITSSAIYNGKSSFSAVVNSGVYIGTNGIALGERKNGDSYSRFQVDSNGNLHATNADITGSIKVTSGSISLGSNFSVNSSGSVTIKSGSINIGSGAFVVDSSGNLTATSGIFKGEVWAGSISSGSYWDGSQWIDRGTLSGGAITSGSITGWDKLEVGSVTGGVNQWNEPTGSLGYGTVDQLNTGFSGDINQIGTNTSSINSINSIFAGYSKADYMKATYSTFDQMTLIGYDVRWSNIKDGDGQWHKVLSVSDY